MKKLFKILGIIVIAIVALMIIIPLFFSDKLLNYGCQLAQNYVNAEIGVKGLNINLFKHFPDATIKIKNVYLKGVGEFSNDTLAAFDKLEATVNVMSLLGDKIKVKSVLLENPRFNVIVLSDGKPNYDIVKADTTEIVEEEADTLPASSFALALKRLEIDNMKVLYADSAADIYATIDDLNFKLSGDLSDTESVISMLLDIAKVNVGMGTIAYVNDAAVSIKSDIEANLETMRFGFKENLFKINELGLKLDGWLAMPDTNIQMDLTFGADDTDFRSILSMVPANYAKDLEGVKTGGAFKFEGGAKGTFNAISFPEFWLNLLVDNARFQYPDLPKSVENINIDVKVACSGNIDSINVDAQKIHLNIADNPIDAKLKVQTSANDIDLDGNLNAAIELSSIADVVPLEDMTLKGMVKAMLSFAGKLSYLDNGEYNKFKANGDISIANFNTQLTNLPPIDISKAHLTISPKTGTLETFNMKFGKSDFNLNGKIDNIFQYVFADSTLKASFNYNSKLIDVNDIFSYDHSAAEAEVEETDTTATEAPEIPKNIDFTLNTSIGKILYDSIVIDNLAGKIGLKNGIAYLNGLKLSTLGGKVAADGLYDGSNAKHPMVDLKLDLNQVDIQKTVKTFNTVENLAPIATNCYGNVSAKVNFKSYMDNTLSPELKTVNGDGRLITNSIAIKGSKLFSMLGETTKNNKLANPELKNLNIGFKIVDGDVLVDTTAFKMNGQDASFGGKLGLDQSLDFDFGITLVETYANDLLGKAVKSDKSGNIKVFATIGGSVTDPKITGFHTSATDILKDVVNEKITEAKTQLSDEAKKQIAEAKKKADEVIAAAKKTRDSLVNSAQKESDKLKAEAKEASDKALAEASKQADEHVAKAKDPVAKIAAKKTADELKKNAQKESDKILSNANSQADKLVSEAKKQGDKIVSTAEQKADKINKEAEQKAENIK